MDWDCFKTISVGVTPFSTITVVGYIYSVPSRLIGYDLKVDIHDKYIELRYGTKILETIPRCFSEDKHCINYRHIVKHLLRKPGAFKNYQYKDALFPSVIFRKTYDALCAFNEQKGSRLYLELLHFTALNNETEVSIALEIILSENEIPTKENVKNLLDMPRTTHPKVTVLQPILNHYDSLLAFDIRSNYV